ncbi:MAG: DUF554 domain-containing protein [Caldilineaceae bacterium]|nr:DUF554 domain-containing protein [Caldilineaceae bacterium]MBP8108542.1 DUF554 domain-containing protein [Caldilineaceae bacterium]MBP8123522.1 DUF554 domain-containing protein [Caldilineaceae bacterium]MBP9074821.1 DUF554 domain-containing protein [Caldilineaceae bacterium]
MTGTIINILTVLLGGMIGVMAGNRLPKRVQETVMAGLGLMTGVIGLSMALTSANVLIPLFSVLTGGIIGEILGIEGHLNRLGQWLEDRFGHRLGQGKVAGWSVTRGFVTASLVFCIGPMTILGSIQDGLLGDYDLLAIKSMLDGFAAIPFAATLGPGVLLSALSIGVIQGGIAGIAIVFGGSLGEVSQATPWVIELTATGGVLIMGIALILLELKQVRVANLLPAIVIAPLIVIGLQALHIGF